MKNGEIRKKPKFQNLDPDLQLDMRFLLEATIDRSAYSTALASIKPLSEFQDIIGTKMKDTAAAIRADINSVNTAISAQPSLMMQATTYAKLSKPQQQLLDAITSSEVLKFSILNAMDAVRMLLITDFEKSAPYYDDEAIVFDVKAKGRTPQVMVPQRVPFSSIKELGNFEIYDHSNLLMVIGKESSSAGQQIKIPIRGSTHFIELNGVPVGKIYLTGRDTDGKPSPVPPSTKEMMLNVTKPVGSVYQKTISDLSKRPDKKFELTEVVTANFTIPTEVEGIITGIWRTLKKSPAVKPIKLSPATFAGELGNLTLLEFKKYFEALVARTSNASGEMSTFDLADTLFFTGLAAVSGMLGLAPPPGPSAGGGGAAGAAGAAGGRGAGGSGGGGGGSGGGSGGGGGTVNRSLSNFLNTTSFIKGANSAEKAANKASLDAIIDRDAMRRELNLFAGGSNFVFTESVDRWCKLAGIKEKK